MLWLQMVIFIWNEHEFVFDTNDVNLYESFYYGTVIILLFVVYLF